MKPIPMIPDSSVCCCSEMAESQDAEIFKFPASFLLSTASDIITVKIRNKKMQISKKVIAFFFHNFYNFIIYRIMFIKN